MKMQKTYINKTSPLIIKGDIMAQVRLDVDEYTIRVLDVVKGKYGLKNRSEALNRFTKEFGSDFADELVDESYLIELDRRVAIHEKKYPNKTMTLTELDKYLED